MAKTVPATLLLLQNAIFSIMLIRASCKTLDPVNPFCALLVNLSEMVSSRFLIALEITLYTQLSKLMGLQFLILVASPFFGINLIVPDLNELVSLPILKQWTEYLCKGTLKNLQNFFRKVLLRPSAPPAERRFACSIDESSSLMDSSLSKIAESLAESLEARTVGLLNMSGPRKFSIIPATLSGV